MKSNNILADCTYYCVTMAKLNEEDYIRIAYGLGIDSDNVSPYISESDIEKFDIPEEAIDYDSCEFDDELLECYLQDILGDYPYYLVFASNNTWNGSSEGMIVNKIVDTVRRPYEISLYFKDKGKRKAEFIESSHDVPGGSTTYIIGITTEEYNMLSEVGLDEVEDFVNKIV